MDYTSIAGPDVRDSQALDGRPRPTAEEEIIGPSSSIFCCRFTAHLGNGRQSIGHSVADAKGMQGALSGQPNAKNG